MKKTLLIIPVLIGFIFLPSGDSVMAADVELINLTEEEIKEKALDEYTDSELIQLFDDQYIISYPGTKSVIEIGSVDKETIDFKADLTVKHWDGEVSFSLLAPATIDSTSKLTSTIISDKVVASNNGWIFEYSAVGQVQDFNEYGGIDMIITAKEKPASNKIYFTYDSTTVTPYYQGELTAKEIEEGAYRPDHVVGSIAFYANGKRNHAIGGINYATGKVGHLYAMRVGDEWCRWSIEGDYIVLTISDIVFNGKYPVVISPVGDTFGYTSVGGTSSTSGANIWRAVKGSPADDGAGDSISLYGESYFAGHHIKGMMVDETDDTILTNGVSAEIELQSSPQWNVSSYVSQPTVLASGSYYVGMIADSNITIYYDVVGSSDEQVYHVNNYASPTNPTPTNTTVQLSIYCTYTPGGGNDPPTVTSVSSTSVEETTANLTGNITATGGENPSHRGFQWDIDSGAPYANDQYESGNFSTGTYWLTVTGLPAGDKIYWRASANNSEGFGYGSELTLHTKPQAPTSLTDTARTSSNITLTWTKGTGSENTTIRYRTDQYPTGYNDGTLGYNGTASTCNVTSLSPGQIYYFRAWAISTDDGNTYSDSYSEDTGYTLPADPSNLALSGANCTTLDAEWTKGTGGDKSMVRWKIGSYPTDETDGTQGYFDTSNSTTLTSLTENATIYVRVWAYDSDSGYYSSGYSSDNASTLDCGAAPPTVTTSAASDLTCNSATGNGNITDTGNATVTVRGFQYGIGSFTDNVSESGTFGTGAFDLSITGLSDNTEYQYRAFATNSEGTGYGNTVNFTTTASSDPTFTTSNATLITNTTARLNGTISGLDCENADDTFWEWGLSTGNYTSNYTDTTNRGNVAVYHDLSSLSANTTYYFRGAARLNGGSWQYGSELYFTTTNVTGCASPENLTVTALTDNHILAEWDTAANVTGYLLLVSNTEYPDDPAGSYAVAYNGTDTTVTLSGYNLDFTEYYFSLWTYCNPYSDDYDTALIGGTAMEGISDSLILLISMIPLIFFSVMAFWKENSIMFMLAAGVSILIGFNCFDVEGSSWTFGVALILWAYSIACLIFGFMCIFKRRPAD